MILQKVLQFQSRGTLAPRLSAIPPFWPKTLPSAPLALVQLTVGVTGSSVSELLLFVRLDRASIHRWKSL
jgi:hypothetical protein